MGSRNDFYKLGRPEYMSHAVVLSDKAWRYVESRRGLKSADLYVSAMIENIEDLSSESTATLDGIKIIDSIESYIPVKSGSLDYKEHAKIARHTIDYLREAYHGRVPRAVFVKKCRDRGLTDSDINEAEKEFAQWIW